ncbi:hypothetical protein QBC40DRAFT_302680 [Triangularia verruculosa]|uniref:Uncharacterized protein n=1 Tax=Triangularia verruculosa TaxID=2587418 RepID=A0AAN6XSI9_9PEZI|nr:hypothetical protein QBC40DRAFT_302680 [Triangularia verruculosa]
MDSPVPAQDGNYLGDLPVVDIVTGGDLILNVTFNTSKETLKAAKKAKGPPGQPSPAALRATVKQGYRVQISVLKDNSGGYFTRLLGDTRFTEAKTVEKALQKLSSQNIKPSEADLSELPVVEITEDDEASGTANLDTVFGDLMRILHRVTITTKPLTVRYLAAIAVLADRFTCTPLVSKWLNAIKFKFPPTTLQNPNRTGPALSQPAEELLRQKILVSWLLDRPPLFQSCTRDLIMHGSRRWCILFDEQDGHQSEHTYTAAWWDLPSDIETELQHRRDYILNTISSIPSHFISLYISPISSRPAQCKLGYTSSPSCDSFQLGEAIRFLTSRNLVSLVDFSPRSYDRFHVSGPPTDYIMSDISYIIKVLKQCPTYQIDKNHNHCGLRGRMGRILEFIEARLGGGGIGLNHVKWAEDRTENSWLKGEVEEEGEKRVFKYTSSVSSDARLRYGGAFAAEKLAREVFTADEWDWTAEEHEAEAEGVSFGKWKLGEKSFPR